MDTQALRALQAPLKDKYRDDPGTAELVLSAEGRLGEGVSCSLETGRAIAEAGLHPLAGGDGTQLCSGDMLLEALVACAGVTLKAVATALGIEVREGTVKASHRSGFATSSSTSRSTPMPTTNNWPRSSS